MPQLVISLLGSPSVYIDRVEVNLQRRKTLALLAYLSVQTQSQSRDELTELLYPELDRTRAKADFRQVLSSLRRAIGEEYIISDRFSISLNLSNGISIDVLRFREFITNKNYKEAIDLYNNEFLSGFYLNENYQFEEWQLSMQE